MNLNVSALLTAISIALQQAAQMSPQAGLDQPGLSGSVSVSQIAGRDSLESRGEGEVVSVCLIMLLGHQEQNCKLKRNYVTLNMNFPFIFLKLLMYPSLLIVLSGG